MARLQLVYDELMNCDTSQVRKASGLTMMDTAESSDSWSLWRALSGTAPAQPVPKDVRGLYLYGARATAAP